HQVTQHRTGGRRAAGPPAVEHERPGRLRFDEDRVEGVADPGERVSARDHRRVHPDTHRAVAAFGDAQQLDHTAHLTGAGDVECGDVGDPLPVHVGGGDPGVEGE